MKIKCAAIRDEKGQIYEGRDHPVCFQKIREAEPNGLEQGFVTDTGEFVDRFKAAEIAYKAGQTKKLESLLFSEDLTGDWPWKKSKETK